MLSKSEHIDLQNTGKVQGERTVGEIAISVHKLFIPFVLNVMKHDLMDMYAQN